MFIASGGSLQQAEPQQRIRWRTDDDDIARPVLLNVPQVELVSEYFANADGKTVR